MLILKLLDGEITEMTSSLQEYCTLFIIIIMRSNTCRHLISINIVVKCNKKISPSSDCGNAEHRNLTRWQQRQ